MSFLYPRTCAIHRPPSQSGEGALGYGGQTAASETVVASGLPCSIQARREGQSNVVGLPADATAPFWYVLIPKRAAALGQIQSHDIVVDDTGNRYQVVQDYWDSLGYRLSVMRLEA